jgi:hypothetical protein
MRLASGLNPVLQWIAEEERDPIAGPPPQLSEDSVIVSE